jgi:hypothetical protein
MIAMIVQPMFAAVGFSILYLPLGGGLGGGSYLHRGKNVRQMSSP